ncbi:Uncharacterised protein [uncultured archaeon]|nr:Uncharacterised protein [uncultured archaeon]
MMRVHKAIPEPIALALAMLEDNGRVLFLLRKNQQGVEQLELPCVLIFKGRDPVAELA